jgi:hypothetical protein
VCPPDASQYPVTFTAPVQPSHRTMVSWEELVIELLRHRSRKAQARSHAGTASA